jgi:hypothetical protein
MYQRGSTANRGGNVDCLRHFTDVGPFFEAILGVRIDAIGALHRMSHCQGDKGFFPLGKFAFSKYGSVVVKEFLGKIRGSFTYIGKFRQIHGSIICFHHIPR